jgi:exonuclease SbcC
MSSIILRLVEVENFMGHEHERLEFGRGVILLAGASGNGKSSLIVDAPGFALFDFRATRVKRKASLARRGSESKDFRVKVAFERSDGLTFEVERGMKGGKAFAYSRDSVTGDTDFDGTAQVHAHIVSLIGFMDAETYRRSFLTEQHSHGVLTDMQAAPRKAFVNRMLDIDIFSDIAKDARSEAKRHAGRLAELQAMLSAGSLVENLAHGSPLDEIERLIDEQDKLIEQKRALRAKLDTDFSAARAHAEVLAAQISKLTPQLAERTRLERERSELAARLAGIDGRLAADNAAERERMTELVTAQAGLVREGKALAVEVEQMEGAAKAAQQRERLTEQHQQAQERAVRAEAERGEKPSVVDGEELARDRKEVERERAELMAEQADARRRIETARAGTCVTCGRDYEAGEAHEHEQQLAAKLEQITARLAALDARKEQLDVAERDRQQAVQAAALFEQRSQTAEKAHAEAASAHERLESVQGPEYDPAAHEAARERLAELRARNLQAREAKAWLASNPDPAELRVQSKQVTEQITGLDEQIATCPDPAHAAKLGEQERTARRHESDLRAQFQVSRSETEVAEQQGEVLAARLAKLSEAAAEAKNLHADVARATELADMTEAFWKHLSDEIRPQLSDIASDLMNRISHGTHPRVELTPDYDLIIHDADGSLYDASELSGGEKDRINFAMRIALTRLITSRTGTPLGYLVLDEIFSGQDEGHIERMIDILDSLQAHYPQMFLISHAPVEDYEIVRYKVDVTERTGRGRVRVYSR